jgi:phage terminase large subunit-like protein
MDEKNNTIQPIKGSNQRKRIDGFAAMLDAFVVLNDKQVEYLNII